MNSADIETRREKAFKKTLDDLITNLGGRKLKEGEGKPIAGRRPMYRFEFNELTADISEYSQRVGGWILRVSGKQRLSDEDYELSITKLEEIASAVEHYDPNALVKCNVDFEYAGQHRKAVLNSLSRSAVKLGEIISEIKQINLEKVSVPSNYLFFESKFPLQLFFDRFKIIIPGYNLNSILKYELIQPNNRIDTKNPINQLTDRVSAVASLYVNFS